MKSSEFERVYTVFDYYDGIRSGIADFNGSPHYYECPFDEEKDDYQDYFFLREIDDETLQLAMEGWAIWQRWYAAWQAGKTSIETHPTLPEDRPRHNEIQKVLPPLLTIAPEYDLKAKGEFQKESKGAQPAHPLNPFVQVHVKWQVL